MAHVLLIGSDEALLEGLAQSLAAAGHEPRIATTLAEAEEQAAALRPLVCVAERAVAEDDARTVLRLPIATGGALLLYHGVNDTPHSAPPVSLQRAVMAELTLPLERHRLLALVSRVEERLRLTGRGGGRHDTPEPRAP